jgi:membrane protease YdiL (CAAX protease family)
MDEKNIGLNARSVACVFGIAWFIPYCAYTTWAHGMRRVDFDISALFQAQGVHRLFTLVASHPVEFTMLAQVGFGCLFIIRSRTISWSTLGFRRTSALWFFIAIAGIVSSYVFSGLLQAVAQAPGNEVLTSGGGRPDSRTYPIGQMLTAFLTVGVATAVIEEVAFRGVLYQWLRANIGPIMGIVLSALIFSLFHLRLVYPGGLLGLSATFQVMLGGILLAFLYEKSGSIWPSIYLHGVNNVIGILQVLAPR